MGAEGSRDAGGRVPMVGGSGSAGSGGSAGVTLIELVAAASLSALVVAMAMALYKDVGRLASRLTGGRDEAMQSRVLFNSMSENALAGGGLLGVGPDRLLLLNSAGRKIEYRWEDSALSVNGRPWGFKLASLEFAAFGPALPRGEEWTRERMEFAGLDSLDDDRDGLIDFEDLDRDRSGELEPEECRHVALLAITMKTVREGVETTHRGAIHPRNHARGWTGEDLDPLPGTGDFGR